MKDRKLNFHMEDAPDEVPLEELWRDGPRVRPEFKALMQPLYTVLCAPCDYRRFFRTHFTMTFLACVVRHQPEAQALVI